jgi:hypothetical protein
MENYTDDPMDYLSDEEKEEVLKELDTKHCDVCGKLGDFKNDVCEDCRKEYSNQNFD